MNNKQKMVRQARAAISKAKQIVISGHINPDGDCLGSLLALGLALKGMNKKVYMINRDDLPPAYRSLPGVGRIMKTTKIAADLAIAVDCSAIELLGKNIEVFKKAKSILEIDHHEYRKPFGDIQFIDHEAAAVGELVYILLKEMNVRIGRGVAENILTSIIVETNLFRLPNVRAFTFKVCYDLLQSGINFSRLAENVYMPKTRQAALLAAICLAKAKFLSKGRLVWSMLRRKALANVSGKDYDADAVANEMLSIKGVKIAILFRETGKGSLRVSLRSRDGINIGRIAQQYDGGGHFDIAGCYIPNNTKSIKAVLSSSQELLT